MHKGYITLHDLIRIVRKEQDLDEPYMVYAPWELNTDFNMTTKLFISEPSTVVGDEDIMPTDVAREALWTFCSGQLLQDVVMQAVEQRPHVSPEEIADGLRFYMENDDFKDYA